MHDGFNLCFLSENFEYFFSPAYCHWYISFDAAHLYCLVGSPCHPLAYTEGLPRRLCPTGLCPVCACIASSSTKSSNHREWKAHLVPSWLCPDSSMCKQCWSEVVPFEGPTVRRGTSAQLWRKHGSRGWVLMSGFPVVPSSLKPCTLDKSFLC